MNRIARVAPASATETSTIPVSQADEALRRTVAAQIGPRRPGVVYYDGPRMVEVRRILRRNAAQFAIHLVDQHAGTDYYTGAVWAGSDRVLKAVAA